MGRRSGLTHSRSRSALQAAVVLAVMLLGDVVRAEAPAPLAVRLPACDVEPFPYEDFVQLLRAQLAQDRGPDIVVSKDGKAPMLQVSGACGARSVGVAIEVTTTRGVRLRREVPFFDLPMDVRGRGLAMVAAELVRAANDAREGGPTVAPADGSAPASTIVPAQPVPPTARSMKSPNQAEPRGAKRPEPPKADKTPTHDERDVATPKERAPDTQTPVQVPRDTEATSQRNVYWGIAAQARLTSPTTTTTTGARAQLRVGDFVAGADWLTSSVDDSLGKTRGNVVAGWVGLVVWSTRQPGWWIGTSPRASFGIAMVDATPSAGSRSGNAREPYVDAAWQFDARWELGASGGVMLGADAGVARGVTAASDDGPVLALGGWFVGARLGLEVAP